jgi:hypothetical protein
MTKRKKRASIFGKRRKKKRNTGSPTPSAKMGNAIIIDLDDTLAIVDSTLGLSRRWEMFIPQAKPNTWCLNIVKNYIRLGYKIIFLTGRLEMYRQITVDWLFTLGIYPEKYKLFMYPEQNYSITTSLSKFKVGVIQNHILPHYFVHFAIDDNLNNVAAIEKLGIKCLHC